MILKNLATLSTGETGSDERRLEGTAVSRGIAIGRAVRLFGTNRQFFRKEIGPADVPAEIGRLKAAQDTARAQLVELLDGERGLPTSAAEIFRFHLLAIDDPKFAAAIENAIRDQHLNAEWAVKIVTEEFIARQLSADEPGFRDRSIDIEDVSERILSSLADESDIPREMLDGSVIIADSIRPSTLVALSRRRPLAIATEHGGWTSHVFIMAREMQIPAVTGLKDITRSVTDGDEVIVDGYNGRVVMRPTQSTLQGVRLPDGRFHLGPRSARPTQPPTTLDGRGITIRVNAESMESIEGLAESGAAGIGLVRSEYLVGHWNASLPNEQEQFDSYEALIDAVAPQTVRIRTFDLNADQLNFHGSGREANPALGLRAIRLGLADEALFRTQARAILRAARERDVAFLLPMVTGIDEIVQAKRMIDQENALLRKQGLETSEPGVGAMIEVPSAVVMIDEILRIVDFVCVGTNDLVQYMLAVDRDNESVAEIYQTLHPAVTRSISTVIKAADHAGLPAVLCGEMAGSPFYTPVLVGMGAREFSMNLNSIDRVRTVIEGISFDESRALVEEIGSASTSREAEVTARRFYSNKWPHLFNADLLNPESTGSDLIFHKK